VSQRESVDSPWQAPVHLNINSTADDFCPTLAPNSHYLFFVSARPGGCGGNDLWVVRRKDKEDILGWGEPENLGCDVNSVASDITPSIFEDEDGSVYLYFSSTRSGGLGGMDIYVSTLREDGTFGVPVNVTELNTAFTDQRPNIRYRDGLEIFFESDRPGALGSTDIYSSTRSSTSSAWEMPENLGPNVNSAALEGRPSLSFDGRDLYFMSNRTGAVGSNDIYVTHRIKVRGRTIIE
jgi:Tol biopolymer transport system component